MNTKVSSQEKGYALIVTVMAVSVFVFSLLAASLYYSNTSLETHLNVRVRTNLFSIMNSLAIVVQEAYDRAALNQAMTGDSCTSCAECRQGIDGQNYCFASAGSACVDDPLVLVGSPPAPLRWCINVSLGGFTTHLTPNEEKLLNEKVLEEQSEFTDSSMIASNEVFGFPNYSSGSPRLPFSMIAKLYFWFNELVSFVSLGEKVLAAPFDGFGGASSLLPNPPGGTFGLTVTGNATTHNPVQCGGVAVGEFVCATIRVNCWDSGPTPAQQLQFCPSTFTQKLAIQIK